MLTPQDLNLKYEELRSLFVTWLAKNQEGELHALRRAIFATAKASGLTTDPQNPASPGRPAHALPTEGMLSDRDYRRIRDIFWDLLIEGIVRPGMSNGNSDLPDFHVTDWGKAKLNSAAQSPYDPDNYLKGLCSDVPDIDPIILTYLTESLHTFRIGCLLSSTVSLGCAAEKALLLLIDAYTGWLKSPDKFKQATAGRVIKRQFDELRKRIDSQLRAELPAECKDGLDVELTALFDFIRAQRNDAGHPTGKEISRERAYANLLLFPVYVRRVYSLNDWLKKNPQQ